MKSFQYGLLVLAGMTSAFAGEERGQPAPADKEAATSRPIVLVGPEELDHLRRNAASKDQTG